MSDYRIGKIVSVSGERIFISLIDYSDGDGIEEGVPPTMIVNLSTAHGPTPLLIGQPGTFLSVCLPVGRLLAMITTIDMRESIPIQSEVKTAEAEGLAIIEGHKRVVCAVPVGTLDPGGKFERGTDVLPTVNSSALAVSPVTINKVYEQYAEGTFSLGHLSLIPSQPANINLDAFLSRHGAILGQTGGGKSWAVASFLQKISLFPQSTAVLFDLHGEYSSAFGNEADVISGNDIELPYWLMNSEELLGLMVDRTESAAPNQIAKFKDLLQAAKDNHPENQALGLDRITIDTPVYFNFKEILQEFRRLDTQMVQGANNRERQGPLFGQFTRLLMRVDSRLNDRRYDLIFNPKTYATSASMEDLFRRLLGEQPENQKKLVIIDLSPVPYDVRNSVISLILRCLFDFSYWYRRLNGASYPIAVFADEAHIYLNEHDSNSRPACESAERIAKEGRKYGISLTVISQRPREVSSTILSQCNSFLCLRISNPDDQSYVKNLLPDSVRGITSMFATLRRGECILLGESVMMPTRIKIDPPSPTPHSDDTSFYTTWNKAHEQLNVADVLNAWRRQGILDK
ncbi:MAG: sea9 [Nitrospirales bacterium]|nr:MAG: sea9 [Nitrospirales bacterium]